MKTQNLTPWCNLFSNELKFDIRVKPLYYRYSLALVLFWLVSSYLLFTSQHLLFAVFLIVILGYFLCALSLNINAQGRELFPALFFRLSSEGECQFTKENQAIGKWQLQRQSKVTFFGCSLVLKAAEDTHKGIATRSSGANNSQYYFIPKMCLSEQDFSRLARVIKRITYEAMNN